MRRREVILFSPHFVSEAAREGATYRATPPLSFLALAGPLLEAGYDVRILDTKWDTDWQRVIRERIDHLLCLGITCLTGPAVADGLAVADYAKSLRPELPVIWGGWHPTFAAGQAIEDPRVDIVVRGMGERAFVEILGALERNESVRSIQGIHYREEGTTGSTPDRPAEPIDQFPPPAYQLIEPERYIWAQPNGLRTASTIFSRGCPFACDFCLDSRNKWFGLPTPRMIDEIEFWLQRGANHIRFYDGNFFLGKPKIVDFCEAVIARGLPSRFRWTATAVGNRVVQMDDELLALLARSGLRQVAIGAESGSDELLARITNKTTVAHTLEAIRRLTRHGINAYLFFVVGYPDEPSDALDRTLQLALDAKTINPNVELFLNFTTPLPGSEVFRVAVERGYVEAPKTFADWAAFDYLHPNLIPIDDAYARRVQRFLRYFSFASPALRGPIRAALRHAAQWRLKRHMFSWPVELVTIDAIKSLRRAIS